MNQNVNNKYSTIIITSDRTKFILPTFFFLAEKYWSKNHFIISGDGDADFNFKNTTYLKRNDSDLKNWTFNIKQNIEQIQSEYIILGLDDFLIVDDFNQDVLDVLIREMDKDHSIVRASLGVDFFCMEHQNYKTINDINLILMPQNQPYRCSTQFSIWRKDFLVNLLNNNRSPWEFEILGSEDIKNNSSIKMIGTSNKFCLRWIEESAYSSRFGDNINVLGLRLSDINTLVEKGILDEDKIQFGFDVYWNNNKSIRYKENKNFKIKDLTSISSLEILDLINKKYGFNY